MKRINKGKRKKMNKLNINGLFAGLNTNEQTANGNMSQVHETNSFWQLLNIVTTYNKSFTDLSKYNAGCIFKLTWFDGKITIKSSALNSITVSTAGYAVLDMPKDDSILVSTGPTAFDAFCKELEQKGKRVDTAGVTNKIGYFFFNTWGSKVSCMPELNIQKATICVNINELETNKEFKSWLRNSSIESNVYTIDTDVTTIGLSALSGCTFIDTLAIPESVTSIETYAFKDCSTLASITLPKSLRFIGSYAFQGCSALTEVIIPDGVTTIEGYAFSNCKSLKKVVIPASVTDINDYIFRYSDSVIAYCEVASKPADWNYRWNPFNHTIWNYKNK